MQGSILYGIDVQRDMQFFTAPVVNVSLPRQNFNVAIGQFPQSVVDITATVNGEQKEFKQIPSNSSLADFGSNTYILADSKDALSAYIQSKRQEHVRRIEGIDYDKKMAASYEKALKQISPSYSNEEETKALNDRIKSLEEKLSETLALMKANKSNQ